MSRRGVPFQPGNQFGRGRPKGSRNRSTMAAQQLLDEHAEPLTRKCIAMALRGDTTAMRLCFDRLLCSPRPPATKLKLLPIETSGDVARALDQVLKAVANGALTATDGHILESMLESRRRAIETQELEARLQQLEQRARESES